MFVDIHNTDKKYSIIYADPPWDYNDKSCNGASDKHYKSMKLEDICSLPVKDVAAENCVLFLWGTYLKIDEALSVIKAVKHVLM